MNIVRQRGWVFFVDEDVSFDVEKVEKWMYFFSDNEFVDNICKNAVSNNIVKEAKHTDAPSGVACFYLHYDDMESHRKVIEYFIENNLIRKTKTGKLFNISFKLDSQTGAGEYGDDFHSEIKLDKFVDLNTGEWIGRDKEYKSKKNNMG